MSAHDLYPERFEAAATIHGYLDHAGVPRDDGATNVLSIQGRVLWLVTATGAMVPKDGIIDGAGIRELAGIANPRTLRRWRDGKGFPEPFASFPPIELWDAREVDQWLAEHRGADRS